MGITRYTTRTLHESPSIYRSIALSIALSIDRSLSLSIYRHASDSVHSGSKEGPSLSHSTVGIGFLRQLDPFGTW
mgnify:CR=1 FL=1